MDTSKVNQHKKLSPDKQAKEAKEAKHLKTNTSTLKLHI